MGIPVALQQLAEGFARDTARIRAVHDDLVLFVKRLQRILHCGEMNGTRNMLRLIGPLSESHHQTEVVLAVQLLLQLLVTDCSHRSLLSSASRSHCASVAPTS